MFFPFVLRMGLLEAAFHCPEELQLSRQGLGGSIWWGVLCSLEWLHGTARGCVGLQALVGTAQQEEVVPELGMQPLFARS